MHTHTHARTHTHVHTKHTHTNIHIQHCVLIFNISAHLTSLLTTTISTCGAVSKCGLDESFFWLYKCCKQSSKNEMNLPKIKNKHVWKYRWIKSLANTVYTLAQNTMNNVSCKESLALSILFCQCIIIESKCDLWSNIRTLNMHSYVCICVAMYLCIFITGGILIYIYIYIWPY